MEQVTFDTTVADDFPVSIRASVFPPEPDVGRFTRSVEIDELTLTDGRPCGFIEEQMTDLDWDRLREEALNAVRSSF